MRIGINLFEFFSPGSRGEGVLNYVRGLIEGLVAIDQGNTYVLFLNRLNCVEFSNVSDRFTNFVVPWDPRKKSSRVLWEQVLLPIYTNRYSLDVLHCPSGTASVLSLHKCVVTYHAANLFFYYNGQFKRHAFGIKQAYAAAMEKFVVARAAGIITDSEFSKQDMVKQLGVHPSKIDVVYLTVPNGTKNGNGSGTPGYPYILNVSSSAIHKNLNGLISAYALLKQRLPSAPKLVIAGAVPDKPAWGMHQRADLEQQAVKLGVGEEVVFVPYPPRDRLIALFRHARLFVFPSLFEGFGLAPLEAMQYGIPVVLSDRASLPEVGGDAAIYINPDDPHDIARGIELGLSDSQLRHDLVQRGLRQVESFGTWERVARQTLGVYERTFQSRN